MYIDGPVQGQSAILRFLMSRPAAVPDDVRSKLTDFAMPDTTPSSVVACIEATELIYARKDSLPPELLSLGADLADMGDRNDFHDYRSSGRGRGISDALRAIDGVMPAAPPANDQAPEPRIDLAEPAATPAAE